MQQLICCIPKKSSTCQLIREGLVGIREQNDKEILPRFCDYLRVEAKKKTVTEMRQVTKLPWKRCKPLNAQALF